MFSLATLESTYRTYWPVCPRTNPLFTKDVAGPPSSPMQAIWLRPLATARTLTPAYACVMNEVFQMTCEIIFSCEQTFDSITINPAGRLTIKRGTVWPIRDTRAPHSVRPHHVALHGVDSRWLTLSSHVQESFNPAPSIVGAAAPCPQPPVFATGGGVYVGADN